MFRKLKREEIERLPRAALQEGIALCPQCWKALGQVERPLGKVIVWCRGCKKNIVIEEP